MLVTEMKHVFVRSRVSNLPVVNTGIDSCKHLEFWRGGSNSYPLLAHLLYYGMEMGYPPDVDRHTPVKTVLSRRTTYAAGKKLRASRKDAQERLFYSVKISQIQAQKCMKRPQQYTVGGDS